MKVRKLAVTRWKQAIVSAVIEEGNIAELFFDIKSKGASLGNIYLARVKDIREEIGAAFLDIGDGGTAYFQLDEAKGAFFAKKGAGRSLHVGDELLVQIKREAMGSKFPLAGSNITLSGEYLVLSGSRREIGASTKLSDEDRNRLKELIGTLAKQTECGWIIRTNAAYAKTDDLQREIDRLGESFDSLKRTAITRPAGTLLLRQNAGYLDLIRDRRYGEEDDIATDDRELYEEIKGFMHSVRPDLIPYLRLYEDRMLPFSKCIGLERTIEEAQKEKVWLKSGGFLLIERTEALTVIDVNSGRAEGKSKAEKADLLFRVNMEAARETARQLRLRNLSGIILIDFINLPGEEEIQKVRQELDRCLKKDSVQARVIDVTKLQLFEVTRKKMRPPLSESLKLINCIDKL